MEQTMNGPTPPSLMSATCCCAYSVKILLAETETGQRHSSYCKHSLLLSHYGIKNITIIFRFPTTWYSSNANWYLLPQHHIIKPNQVTSSLTKIMPHYGQYHIIHRRCASQWICHQPVKCDMQYKLTATSKKCQNCEIIRRHVWYLKNWEIYYWVIWHSKLHQCVLAPQ